MQDLEKWPVLKLYYTGSKKYAAKTEVTSNRKYLNSTFPAFTFYISQHPLLHSQPPNRPNAEAASVPLEDSVDFSPEMTPVHYGSWIDF